MCHCSHCFPSICHEVMKLDDMILGIWVLSFKLTFSLSSFSFIKRLFSSFSFSDIRVVSSVYLRLLIFLLAILIQVVIFLNFCNMGDFFSHSGYYKTGIYYVLHLICLSLTALSGKGNRNWSPGFLLYLCWLILVKSDGILITAVLGKGRSSGTSLDFCRYYPDWEG